MITPYNILRHELVGLNIKIVDATHEGYKCKGKIVNETRNTINIETSEGIKRLPKDCITLEVKLPKNAIVRIDGKLLIARPENRIKKKYRIKFA
ncbi:MAG TPA: ribonuclease P protein component 1 [Candidatus Altiarchaeales archaeon]|nr:ribonuclease P protein component 1 [Candidatus Altiarchaeales archaeon]